MDKQQIKEAISVICSTNKKYKELHPNIKKKMMKFVTPNLKLRVKQPNY